MINNFNFSKTDIEVAKTFFDAADDVFEDTLKDTKRDLHKRINTDGEIDIHWISDATIIEETLDENGVVVEKQRPIVDLVQQGGGMWGIALLGYCYIMEKVGIRFYSHGGTSAGAINALFLASIPASIYKNPPIIPTEAKRGALKSELLTLIVSNMDFSKFMNRGGLAGRLQKQMFKNFNSLGLKLAIGLPSVAIIFGMYWLLGWILNGLGMGIADVRFFSFIIGTMNIIAFFLLIYIIVAKIVGEDFGLNTGQPFLEWAKTNLKKIQVESTADLYQSLRQTKLIRNVKQDVLKPKVKNLIRSNMDKTAMNSEIENQPLVVTQSVDKAVEDTLETHYKFEHPKIVMITSNLTHNRIVRFPKRASEYWDNHENVNPAAYVRASMSLPFIFRTFIPNIKDHYKNSKDPKNKIKLKARMVDGGMLSNFPIREFHRSDNKIPTFPTFGVLLSKRKQVVSENNLSGEKNSLHNYVMSYFKTFRNFYDNDFMFNHDEIEKRVVTVDTRQEGDSDKHINWLNFWMDNNDKKLLFVRGAEAAIRQLEKFEWKAYKELRIKQGQHGN